ncbi:glucose-6-phosphate dehydrogenase [Mycobacterium heckeshornense]|uniref:Glucose-6-phosphate 1-dehydrogenase n=1 Tax=Mycobacterium heckeshornense TaxID=110505 RepID=A0A2G8B9A4_9MYCO|nr:glucose-6-phosphate dehydrogenase [Mycobacterium heckeshornense]KMV21465.1 glucose-6-phosphate dehydrogenase [Mycobacterium heckeshornense]MCV7034100.1 glucose-6-phosphate dehydrogenase [Mycobacterium heckeshornense]PIJ34333.1 glucose-6-phosphate dehydrogenase [Mycobacterium heckeshornense]BCO34755.1 glucose-6-phosphate 1-dehydrogenase 1 [Mycobacterium heckeshornense]BCQ07929.1 glucose-6-phosphate 1-dehydrogenase 1 [Mycobacterium heckeshornense]
MAEGNGRPADLLVIFGITGDLARKMTFRALYRLERRKLLECPVIGIASDDITVEQLVNRARDAIKESGESFDEAVFNRLAERLSYLSGDVTDSRLYAKLAERISSGRHPLYYLEMPPVLFAPIVENLGQAGLLERSRVAVEKPFGHDLASAQELNARMHAVLDEKQILRVDHFLGKQPVVELEYLRFANQALAELWDRHSISEIHLTMAEDFGVEERGKFYDAVGALRDVVQNHLLQVLALVAMEPPVGPSADDLNDKRVEVFRAMPALDPAHCVRGQYRGYRDVAGVAGDSTTETFVALRLEIDNWRWAGVPIFLRAGKALPEKVTEVRLFLRRVPALAFLPNRRKAEPNQIVLRIDPEPGMRLQLAAQDENTWRPVHLDSSFAEDLGEPLRPYERLLHAGLIGDHQLFAREDSIEETWRIVQPLLDAPGEVHQYEPGSWGPEAAQSLLRGHHSWSEPWMPGDKHAQR